MKKLLLLIVLALVAVTTVQIWATQDRTDQKAAMGKVDDAQQAPIGGAFTLTDHTGKVVHDTDFRGKVLLVFFGFTRCPDMCPITVSTLSKTMGLLGDKASQVQPLFISVDPENDTPKVIADFLKNFDSHILGLTGTTEQIKQVSDSYKVYFAKVNGKGGAVSDNKQDKGDYSLDHSGYIYLMSKDGQFIKVLPYNVPEDELAQAVTAVLN